VMLPSKRSIRSEKALALSVGTAVIRLCNAEPSAFSACKLTAPTPQAKHYLHANPD